MSVDKKSPVLVVMAAGMGSRFGGLKQIEDVDGRGHALIDYAIYDAALAGFDEVVFIIREEIAKDFCGRLSASTAAVDASTTSP